MKTIFKYPLAITEEQYVYLPAYARVLSIQTQDGMPCLWAEIETDTVQVHSRAIHMYDTGQEIQEENISYIDTFQTESGYVFHCYEKVETVV